MSDKIQNMLKLFTVTYTSTDTSQIHKAEEEINKMCPTVNDLLSVLISCMTLDLSQCNLDLKKSIVIYFKNLLKKKEKTISKEAFWDLFKFFMSASIQKKKFNLDNISIQNMIKDSFKHMVSKCPEELLKDVQFTQGIINYINELNPKNQIDQNYPLIMKDILDVLSLVFKGKLITKENAENIFTFVFNLSDELFKVIQTFIDFSQKKMDLNYISALISLFLLLANLTKKTFDLEFKFTKALFDKYSSNCEELLGLNINNESPEQIIYFSGNEELNQRMNIMKASIFKFIIAITKIFMIGKLRGEKNDFGNNYYPFIHRIFKLLENSFQYTIKNKLSFINNSIISQSSMYNCETEHDEKLANGYNIILYRMLSYIYYNLSDDVMANQFKAGCKSFLKNFLFPLLTCAEEEVAIMETDGQSYFDFITDMFENREVKHFRMAGLSLLDKIFSTCEDSSNFVFVFILQMLEFTLHTAKPGIISQEELNKRCQIYLTNRSPEDPMENVSLAQKIDFCFELIIINHEFILNGKMLNDVIYRIMSEHISNINEINSEVIRQKLCYFYQSFTNYVLGKKRDDNTIILVQNILNFLFNHAVNQEYTSLSLQASQTLSEIIHYNNPDYQNNIHDAINSKFESMVDAVGEIDSYLFFDTLADIIEHIPIAKRELVFKLNQNLVKRALTEIGNGKGSSFTINQILHILIAFLRGINGLNPTSGNEIDIFEDTVEQLVKYIQNPEKIDFHDELILTVDYFNRITNKISSKLNSIILSVFIKLIGKSKVFNLTYFDYLVKLVKYDTNKVLMANQKNDIIDLAFNVSNFDDAESKLYSGLLIMEVLLRMDTGDISDKTIGKLILVARNITAEADKNIIKGNQCKVKDEIEDQIALTWLSLPFLLILKNISLTIQQMIKNNCFLPIISGVPVVTLREFKNYRMLKIIIIGLCHLLSSDEGFNGLMNINNDYPVVILMTTFSLIKTQKENQIKKLKKFEASETKVNFVDAFDDENEEDEYEEHLGPSENEIKRKSSIEEECKMTDCCLSSPLDYFGNILDREDEFIYFQKTINYFKEKHPETIQKFEGQLVEVEKQSLKRILELRNINVEFNNEKLIVPRKTVRIIRKSNNANNTQGIGGQ
ncbi:MAG: hypothetical protein MJ252_08510 [archaeon]|nr:hypothetical protein [archaeon]